MSVSFFADLTWTDVEALERGRTVVILPVGAIEAHGPHLPLATDTLISQAMAEEGARRLESRGHRTVILPALPFTAAPFAAAFKGTLSLTAATVTAVVVELGKELARHGFGVLAIANSHLDPTHLGALRDALEQLQGAPGAKDMLVVCPDLTRKPWALRLSDEFKSGACHAGQFETSIIIAQRPDLVRDDRRRALESNPSSLSKAIQKGQETFAEAGGPMAYFGDPAAATAAEGVTTIAILGGILEDAVLRELQHSW